MIYDAHVSLGSGHLLLHFWFLHFQEWHFQKCDRYSDILKNDFWDHFDTFGEIFYFDTFKNDTLKVYE